MWLQQNRCCAAVLKLLRCQAGLPTCHRQAPGSQEAPAAQTSIRVAARGGCHANAWAQSVLCLVWCAGGRGQGRWWRGLFVRAAPGWR